MGALLLCADDSTTIQKVVELSFADSDIQVVCVSDGEAAIRRFQEVRPDIVLLDVCMPARDGYEVCEFVKRTPGDQHARVLLLSSPFEPYDGERARLAGADGHLSKPFESATLVLKVRALMAGDPSSGPADQPAGRETGRLRSVPPPPRSAPPVRPAPAVRSAVRGEPAEEAKAPHSEKVPISAASPPAAPTLAPADIDAIARRLVELISPDVVREVAWEVVPDLVDMVIRSRLDQQDPGGRRGL